ncbi:hypothetical protein [Halovivax gelatinilyticus]|uniref:hypothetical protein n=1 Tax=Halovivax gelatinilyticus TaxID=2961597 RepID=UPI0020CA824C|nr:hypothetical protein [Halovivax gelatinilyticus]
MDRRTVLSRGVAVAGTVGLAGCGQLQRYSNYTPATESDGLLTARRLRRHLDFRALQPTSHAAVGGASIDELRAVSTHLPEGYIESQFAPFRNTPYPFPALERVDEQIWTASDSIGVVALRGSIDVARKLEFFESHAIEPTATSGAFDVYRLDGRRAIGFDHDWLLESVDSDRPVSAVYDQYHCANGQHGIDPASGRGCGNGLLEPSRQALSVVVRGLPPGHLGYVQSPGPTYGVTDSELETTPAIGYTYAIDGATTNITMTVAFTDDTDASVERLDSLMGQTHGLTRPTDPAYDLTGRFGRVQGTIPTNDLETV